MPLPETPLWSSPFQAVPFKQFLSSSSFQALSLSLFSRDFVGRCTTVVAFELMSIYSKFSLVRRETHNLIP